MSKIGKIIIFDFDGVLVDSFQLAFETNKLFSPKGVDLSESRYRGFFEGNVYNTMPKASTTEGGIKQFFDIYSSKLFDLPVAIEIENVLSVLSKEYRMIIVSSTTSAAIDGWLKKNGLGKYFLEIMGSDVNKNKEKKIKLIFEKYKVKPEDCVFITDTLGDLIEGQKVGVDCLAVTYGYHEKEVLKKGKAVGFINRPEDIVAKVREYFTKI